MNTEEYVLVTPSGVLEGDCLVHLFEAAGIRTAAGLDAADTAVAVVLALPGRPPRVTVERLRVQSPGLPILVVTTSDDEDTERLQRDPDIQVVTWHADGRAISETVLALLGGQVHCPVVSLNVSADPLRDLTSREQDIVALLAEGRRNDEIAAALGISCHTVRTHVNHVLTKLGVSHRHAAAAIARRSVRGVGHRTDLGRLELAAREA